MGQSRRGVCGEVGGLQLQVEALVGGGQELAEAQAFRGILPVDGTAQGGAIGALKGNAVVVLHAVVVVDVETSHATAKLLQLNRLAKPREVGVAEVPAYHGVQLLRQDPNIRGSTAEDGLRGVGGVGLAYHVLHTQGDAQLPCQLPNGSEEGHVLVKPEGAVAAALVADDGVDHRVGDLQHGGHAESRRNFTGKARHGGVVVGARHEEGQVTHGDGQPFCRGAVTEAVQHRADGVVAVGLQLVQGEIHAVKARVRQKIRGGRQGILAPVTGVGMVAGGDGHADALAASRQDRHTVTFLSKIIIHIIIARFSLFVKWFWEDNGIFPKKFMAFGENSVTHYG